MLLDTLQELRDAGAEAIEISSLDGPAVRVVASTSFVDPVERREAAPRVEVDGTELTSPYRFRVIGDSRTLAAALDIPGGVLDVLRQRDAQGVVTQRDESTITSLRAAPSPRYARPADATTPRSRLTARRRAVIPEDLQYTKDHEWVRTEGDTVRVGVTDYAQDALGDIVFVTLPEAGTQVTAGETCGEVESTKSVSDIYAPVTGTVVERNEALDATPSWSTPTRTATAGCSRSGPTTAADVRRPDGLLDAAALPGERSAAGRRPGTRYGRAG